MQLLLNKPLSFERLNEHLHESAISLKPSGLSELGWRREDIERVMAEAQTLGWAVLGGDVCELLNSRTVHLGDSWSVEPAVREAANDFVRRSIQYALKYIEAYPQGDRDIFFVPVFCECAD